MLKLQLQSPRVHLPSAQPRVKMFTAEEEKKNTPGAGRRWRGGRVWPSSLKFLKTETKKKQTTFFFFFNSKQNQTHSRQTLKPAREQRRAEPSPEPLPALQLTAQPGRRMLVQPRGGAGTCARTSASASAAPGQRLSSASQPGRQAARPALC